MRSRGTRTFRRLATTLLLATLVASVMSTTGGSAASASPSSRLSQKLAHSTLDRGSAGAVWIATGRNPSRTTIARYAKRYDVIVLKSRNTAALKQIKKINRSITVLMFKDLASTRKSQIKGSRKHRRDFTYLTSGVGYKQSKYSWFAHDVRGKRITWRGTPGAYQMATWSKGYRDRWTSNVVKAVSSGAWDGVYADHDQATLRYYRTARLRGTRSLAATDSRIRSGMNALVSTAGKKLNARSKMLVISNRDGKMTDSAWRAHTKYGGGTDHKFTRVNHARNSGFVTASSWASKTSKLSAPLVIAMTPSARGDYRAARFGYGSALVRSKGLVAWAVSTSSTYASPTFGSWQAADYTAPQTARKLANGLWTREYRNAFVIVNPTGRAQSVTVPARFGGAKVTVGAYDAKLLKPVAPKPPTPPTPPAPPATGVPNASNTGVPDGTNLTVHHGDLKITQPGTVVSGLDVRGFVDVKASNVTIKNSVIRGRNIGTSGKATLLSAYGDHTNLVVQDSTLAATYPSMYLDGLKGRNFTATRLDISGVVDTAMVFGGTKTVIMRSWLHGNSHYATGVTGQSDGKTHDDNIQVEGGSGISITDNRIEGSDNAAVMVTQNHSRVTGLTITGNLLAGGACTINTGEKGKGAITGMSISKNRFGASKYYGKTCPMLLPKTSPIVVADNVWDLSGSAAKASLN